jgi:hypothetical protein
MAQALRATIRKQPHGTQAVIEAAAPLGKWTPILIIEPQAALCAADTLNLDVFSPTLAWHSAKANRRVVVLKGGNGVARIVTTITTHSHDMLRVETRVTLRRSMRIEYLREHLQVHNLARARISLPHGTAAERPLAGDVTMPLPAAIIEADACVVAIIGNVRAMTTHRRVPLALGLHAAGSELTFGFTPYRLDREGRCVHYDSDTCDVGGVLRYSYYIYYDEQSRRRDGVQRVVHRLWRLFAEGRSRRIAPQRVVLEQYGEHLTQYLLSHIQPDTSAVGELFVESEHAAAANTQALMPIAAVALGLTARRTRSKPLHYSACTAIDVTLRRPQTQGLWSTAGKETTAVSNLTDLSWQAYWLCRWQEEVEVDPRIPPFLDAYARRLLSLQKHGGHIPACVDPATGYAERFHAKTAATALHLMFLCRYYRLNKDPRVLQASRRAANFVIRTCIKPRQWTTDAAAASQRRAAPHPALAMWWAAQGLLELHIATRNARYLSYGLRAVDDLLLLQQIWDPPFVPIACFGGFGAGTPGVHWNIAPHALFATTLCEYYRITGIPAYFTRGVAAVRAAIGMINCLENTIVAPLAADAPRGWTPAALALSEPLSPISTLVAAPHAYEPAAMVLAAQELIWRTYGDLYVDTSRSQAFGINGVVVIRVHRDLAGHAVYGREALGVPRTITVRSDSGQSLTLTLKPRAAFEFQL